MKTLFYILLLLLALPFTGIAQNDSAIVDNKETPNFKNQMDFDVEVLAISLGYKRKIAKNWLAGPSIGLGPLVTLAYIHYDNEEDYQGAMYSGLIHVSLTANKYNETNKLSFEAGTRVSFLYYDEGKAYFIYCLGGSIFYGGKVQVGLKIMAGHSYDDRSTFFSSSFVLRIPRKW